jgi:hypothetical protein
MYVFGSFIGCDVNVGYFCVEGSSESISEKKTENADGYYASGECTLQSSFSEGSGDEVFDSHYYAQQGDEYKISRSETSYDGKKLGIGELCCKKCDNA